MLTGLVGICVGTYALLDQTAPRWLVLPGLVGGVALAAARASGRAGRRVAAQPLPPGPRGALAGDRGRAERAASSAAGTSCLLRGDPVLHPPLDACPRSRLDVAARGAAAALLAAAVSPPPVLTQPSRRPPGRWPMLELRDLSFSYADGCPAPQVLRHVDLTLEEGELVLVAGRTGVGQVDAARRDQRAGARLHRRPAGGRRAPRRREHRCTCRRATAPTSSGTSARTRPPASSPTPSRRSWPTGWSSSASTAATMRRRVEETLDLLGIADLRDRDLRTLSGGQQQRVAIGSVLTMHPRLLVLDEPTSALDPTAAEDVLATLTRLVHDLGVTVVLAEHRLERVVPVRRPDRAGRRATGGVSAGEPGRDAANVAGRAADRGARPLGGLVAAAADRARRPARVRAGSRWCRAAPRRRAGRGTRGRARGARRHGDLRPPGRRPRRRPRRSRAGQVTALMGRNGSGKSSLMWALQGSRQRVRWDRCAVAGQDPADAAAPTSGARLVGLVPADRRRPALPRDGRRGVRGGRPRRRSAGRLRRAALLDRLVPGIDPDAAPARPLRGAAARAGARGRAHRRAAGGAASTSRRAASTTPARQALARDPRLAGRGGSCRARRDPRRGVRGPGRRPGRRARRGRGGLRGPDRARSSRSRRPSPRRCTRSSAPAG